MSLTFDTSSTSSPSTDSPMTPDEIISEKSAKIKTWVVKRLEELEDQNNRLKAINLTCTNRLKILTSFAEKQKQSKTTTNIFSQSCITMLPSSYSKHFLDGSMTEGDNCAALMDYCRTSDDSGLTSDSSGAMTAAACIMTRSTAPSITSTKSPRTKKRDARVNHRAERGEEVMSSATDCSPYDEAAKPISVNRKLSKNTTKVNNVERSNDEETKTDRSSIERDSLDSHSGDDGYNEYVEEEEEIFEKVKRTNEPFSTLMLKRVPKTIIQDIPSPEYVNLQDMVNSKIINNHYSSIQEQFKPSIRDTHNYDSPIIKRDVPQYADIIKDRTHIPNIKNPVERRLHEMAEKCLSIVDTIDGQTPNQHFDANTSSLNFFNSSLSFGDHNNDQSKKNSQTMSLCSVTQLNNINNNESPNNMRNGSIKISPAVSGISSLRTSLIPGRDNYEKQGNLIQMSDNRLKSIKRRFFVLKNGTLSMYKSQKSLSREEEPTFTFTLKDIKSIVRINNKSGVKGIQITTTEQVLRYHAESDLAIKNQYESFFSTNIFSTES